ncbi:hypothetical protein BKA69DRAFT_4138 [Paraphysoderma sedebokerense]|nr:hypothetical protein BKA69DRAFT_4138 [Paraphysoderma sedebokerense]
MNIISLCVLLVHLAIGVLGDRPWFLHSSAVSAALNTPTYTVLHSTGNSTHFFLLDQFFSIHYFRLASGSVVYDKTVDNQDGAGVSGSNWRDTRTSVDVKIGLNPYNSQLYMVKYADPGSSLRLMLYRYNSANARTYSSYFEYFSYPTFSTTYAHPRVKMAFDSTYFYVAHYNDPTRASKGGYFIARLTHTFKSQTTLTSSSVGVLSIDFNCHQSPYICMWLTNQTVIEYSMSTLSKYRTYSSVIAPTTLRFNPQIVETSDGGFTYYLHHTTINGINALVQKKKPNHDAVSNESAQLQYDLSNPPPEAFGLAISSSGQIIAGMTTTPSPSVGIGDRDIAVFRYSSTLQLESQFLLSTTQQDNVSSIFSPNGDGNTVVVCGTTDGAINSPTSTSTSRKAFVARFNYFSINSVSTSTPNIVLSGETVNITFSTLPPSATTGTPLVTFNLQACTSVKWTGSILSATIPPGSGGPYELLVQFNYLPHNPSVSMNTLSYMLNPVILEVWPRQGPAVGYNITITGNSLFPQNQLVTAFIGGTMCTSVLRVNLTAISCRTPPGTGRNVSVVLSNGGINNSTQNFQIAYNPPVLTTIIPTAVPTVGTTVILKNELRTLLNKSLRICRHDTKRWWQFMQWRASL